MTSKKQDKIHLTKSGRQCKMCLSVQGTGKVCPTHSLSTEALTARNRKVASSFRERDSAAFLEQRKSAGRTGFEKTSKLLGRQEAVAKLREYKLRHTTSHEQDCMDLLNELGIEYEREAYLGNSCYFVDFLLPGPTPIVVEVNGEGHYRQDAFGQTKGHFEERIEADKLKRGIAKKLGYLYLELDYRCKDSWQEQIEKVT